MKKNLLGGIFIVIPFLVAAQDETMSPVNVVPPSPNASAIAKFVEIPVSYYTGTPNISYPVFTIKTQQLSLPISLSYDASGLRVEDHATWVGAGWTLLAGGAISRTIKGLPDEFLDGERKGYYYNNSMDSFEDCSDTTPLTNEAPANPPDSVAAGLKDTEYDYYTISAPGISGKFHINKDGDIVTYAVEDWNFTTHPFINPASLPDHTSAAFEWVVVDDKGITYKFSTHERIITTSSCGTDRSSYTDPTSHQSTWYLDEISIGDEWIKFEYDGETIYYPKRMSVYKKIKLFGDGPQTVTGGCWNNFTLSGRKLSRVYSSNGYEVLFAAGDERADLEGSDKLESITIKWNDAFIAKHKLTQNYFNNNRKLRLDTIQQVDENANALNAGQVFEYYTGSIPELSSDSQDFWGFYNGVNQETLIPQYKDSLFHLNDLLPADRQPNLAFCKIGSLKKIHYPTGGYTEFEYELHQYYDSLRKTDHIFDAHSINEEVVIQEMEIETGRSVSYSRDNFSNGPLAYSYLKKWNGSAYLNYAPASAAPLSNRVILPAGDYRLEVYSETSDQKFVRIEFENLSPGHIDVGGLRIRRIKNYDPLTGTSTSKRFEYNDTTGISSAVLFRFPSMAGHVTETQQGEIGGTFGTVCFTTDVASYLNMDSYSPIDNVVYHGSHIGYSCVREFEEDESQDTVKGHILYRYINVKDHVGQGFPYIPDEDFSYKNGKLLVREVYQHVPENDPLLIQGEYNTYAEEIGELVIAGANLKRVIYSYCYQCGPTVFRFKNYGMAPTWHYLTSTQSLEYRNGEAIESTQTYSYDTNEGHHQYVSIETEYNAAKIYEEQVVRHTTYPALIKEQEVFLNSSKVSGVKMDYTETLPQYFEKWNAESNSYERIKDYYYDSWRVQKEVNHIPNVGNTGIKSYLWGYDDKLPIAEIQNAEASDCLYDSFEDLTSGYSTTHAKTGSKSHDGTLSVPLPGAGTYRVSYWYKDGANPWQYFQTTASSSPVSIGSNGDLIDELTVVPLHARISTMLYTPEGQIQSTTDINGQVTYYQYDDFKRLKYIMDNDKNIIKYFDYQYKSN